MRRISARSTPLAKRGAFTLFEVLMATALTLLMMGAVVSIFGLVSTSINDSRSTLEMSERLRATALRLQQDLQGVTVTMMPPRRPEDGEGYFEYIEGPNGVTRRNNDYVPGFVLDDLSDRPLYINETAVAVGTAGMPGGLVDRDTTIGDNDDILMFTSRSRDAPFAGRYSYYVNNRFVPQTILSNTAEIAWFVRGRTLYRRVLLVAPWKALPTGLTPDKFYLNYDLSARLGQNGIELNTLGDLTKRESRFAHYSDRRFNPPSTGASVGNLTPKFPFPVFGYWNSNAPPQWYMLHTISGFSRAIPTLPTLAECCSQRAIVGALVPANPFQIQANPGIDLWSNRLTVPAMGGQDLSVIPAKLPHFGIDNANVSGNETQQSRYAEDVVLTNVIGFDVKAWDPGAPVFRYNINGVSLAYAPGDLGYWVAAQSGFLAGFGAYVDLGYGGFEFRAAYKPPAGAPLPLFDVPNYDSLAPRSTYGSRLGRVYDTWSTHYNQGGTYGEITFLGTGMNGFDDTPTGQPGYGVVDDPEEMETKPPYPVPLRGIQVKIRTFDPASRQIREMTVVQDFLPH